MFVLLLDRLPGSASSFLYFDVIDFDVVPGLNDGSTFRSSFDERIGFNNAGSVLFRAGVSDSRVGIFGTTPSGELV